MRNCSEKPPRGPNFRACSGLRNILKTFFWQFLVISEYGDSEYGGSEYGDSEYDDSEYGDSEYGDSCDFL